MIASECLCGARDELDSDTWVPMTCWSCGKPMIPWAGLPADEISSIAQAHFATVQAQVEARP
jgi:hypothetical protein